MTDLIPTDTASAILNSYRMHLGFELIDRSGDQELDAQKLHNLDAVVLGHISSDDPHFIYANKAAAQLWRMRLDELIGMPSRLTAPPNHRESRSAMLGDAARTGFITGYSGTRIAHDGTLFTIENATLWNVDFPQGGGQAVVFKSWHYVKQ